MSGKEGQDRTKLEIKPERLGLQVPYSLGPSVFFEAREGGASHAFPYVFVKFPKA